MVMTGVEKSKKSLFKSFQTKATAVLHGVADLVTDAVPSRTRSSNDKESPPPHAKKLNGSFGQVNLHVEDDIEDQKSNFQPTFVPTNKNSHKKKKNVKNGFPEFTYTANQNVTNISYSNNVHIGPSLTQEFNVCDHKKQKKNDTQDEYRPPVVLTDEIRHLFSDNSPCTRDHILHLESHIGKNWRKLGLSLKFSPGQLDQLEVTYKQQEELVFQMLLQWTQQYTDSATLGCLATALWGCDEKDAVLRLSEFQFLKH